MASPAQTPPPKSSQARHQHSKSATPVAPGTVGKAAARRQRNNRNNNESNITSPYQSSQHVNGFNQSSQYKQNQGYYTFVQPGEYADSSGTVSEGPRAPPKQRQARQAQRQPTPNNSMESAALPNSPPGVKSPMANGAVMTPARSQAAYAGPTFHASPAPSALPVPKFFSKSVPGTSTQPSLQSRLENEVEEASPGHSPPSPPAALLAEPSRHEDSPLDLLFKADRAEKARRGSGLFTPNGKQNQAAQAGQLLPNGTPKTADPSHHSRHSSTGSSKGLFMMELDGGAAVPPRPTPAVTAPASRSVTAPSRIPQTRNPTRVENDTQALKDLLFSLAQPKPQPATPYAGFDGIPSEPSSRFHTPSPFNQSRSGNRSASGPTTPAPQTNDTANPQFFYGNRNLSPLFKAAKTDSAKRTSSLRQEVTAASPTLNQSRFPFGGEPESPINSVPPLSSNNADPRLASRQYSESVMNSPSPFASPRPYAINDSSSRPTSQILQPNFHRQSAVPRTAGAGPPQAHMPSASNKQPPYPPPGTPEVRSMEDSLRRMLKLSSPDSSSTGVR
jgi:hypothetical protein